MRRFPWVLMVAGGVLIGGTAFAVLRPDTSQAAPAPPASRFATVATVPTTVPPVVTSVIAPDQEPLVIQAVGDVNFDPAYITGFADSGYQVAFDGLEGLFLDDDLTVINLECPPTDAGSQLDKQYTFRCDPAALPVAAVNGSTLPTSPTTTPRTGVSRVSSIRW